MSMAVTSGHAAAQQHADGPVHARQLVDLQCRPSTGMRASARRSRGADAPAATRCADRNRWRQATTTTAKPWFCSSLAPVHQHARCPRQVGAEVLVDAAEARHHVAEQEHRHQQSRAAQDRRIDGSTDQFLAQQVDLLLVGDEARQRFANGAGPLARPHRRDVEGREASRQFLERRRQGPAFEQSRADQLERASRAGYWLPSRSACRWPRPGTGRHRAVRRAPG